MLFGNVNISREKFKYKRPKTFLLLLGKKLHNWFIMTEGLSLQLVPKSLSDSSALNVY